MSNPAFEVQKFGQSLWLDFIHRDELKSGGLQYRIDEEGILGVTSNPSIFKRISESILTMKPWSNAGFGGWKQFMKNWQLRIFSGYRFIPPIYDRTNKRDGYTKAVSPRLADNTTNHCR
jgi:transaldolase/glucose-6-phosphate isomerase